MSCPNPADVQDAGGILHDQLAAFAFAALNHRVPLTALDKSKMRDAAYNASLVLDTRSFNNNQPERTALMLGFIQANGYIPTTRDQAFAWFTSAGYWDVPAGSGWSPSLPLPGQDYPPPGCPIDNTVTIAIGVLVAGYLGYSVVKQRG